MVQVLLQSSRRFTDINFAGWGVVALVVLGWELLTRTGALALDYVPAPSAVLDTLISTTLTGALVADTGHTLGVAFAAFGSAVVIGGALGALLALQRTVWIWTMASVDFLRSVPVIALMPIVLLVWGSSNLSEYLVATYSATWLMVVNTLGGVRGVHERLHDVGQTLRLTRRDAVMKVILPAALPSVLVGARLAAVSAFIAAIVAEMIIHPAGIGWALVSAQTALDSELLFAYAVASGILGYLVNAALVGGVSLAFPGMRQLIQAGGAR